MKKLISIILTISLIFTLSSCANTAKPAWQDHLDLGQKYLLDGDYEQAIIEFNKVIEIEPKNVDAYLGLAEAYVAAGDYDSAISVLEQGYAETENQTLQDRINELRGLAAEKTEVVTSDSETIEDPAISYVDTINQEAEPQIIKQVSLGGSHSAAITADGSLYMWGNNNYGQLGNGTAKDSHVQKIMDNVISVSLGDHHSAAITEDGSLYMWGENYYGQLGNGKSGGSLKGYDDGIDSNVPIKIIDNVVSVSLGGDHSAAITTDGSLYMWGSNTYGKLGNGEYVESHVPIKIMDNVAYVSLGEYHSAAITTDGGLYMWGGENSYGELGHGKNKDSTVPIRVMNNVVSVSIGFRHSAAITTDGSLYLWGNNYWGQLGNGKSGDHIVIYDDEIDSKTPIKIMDNVVSVSLGWYNSAAITADGSLYMWGCNAEGRLGNGTTEDSSIPIKIMDNVVSVSLTRFNSSAITTDGSLYMWGDGMGTVPIKIEIPTETGVSIIIKDYEFFENGFYYEDVDENSFSIVDFDYGISGHFNYSRELTNQEYENWFHGGKILTENGVECSVNATFFSTPDGVFAVELPKDMPKGNYIYVLHQYVNDKYCEARIPFTIN